MSPIKPRPAVTKKISSAAGTASSIPRRVKPSSKISTKTASTSSSSIKINSLKGNASTKTTARQSAKNISIFSDSTATLAPEHIVSYLSHAVGANKENIIPYGGGRPNVNRANNNGGSPRRLRSGITKTGSQKPPLSPYKKKSFGYNRIPLRELDTQEVFERDEAVLGDLRRRRSGEHSGTIIEINSVFAFPSPNTTNAVRMSSTTSSSTDTSVSAAATEYDERAIAGDPEKLHVLRRSESEEALRKKLDAILASTSSGNKASKGKVASMTTHQKSAHPAIRQMSPGFSPHRSEASAPSSPAKSYSDSPLRVRHTPSPIAKASPSSIRPLPKITKALGTILSEKKLVATVEGKDGEKAKKVIINTSAATGEALKKKKKKAATKKIGTSSLKRAATRATTPVPARDPSRPPLALTGGRVMGLEGMRKMR